MSATSSLSGPDELAVGGPLRRAQRVNAIATHSAFQAKVNAL
ncbi:MULTISPECIES: hypothetical protein [Kineosporia]|nr:MULTISPECIES: hypothetical protein [Kineosporia]